METLTFMPETVLADVTLFQAVTPEEMQDIEGGLLPILVGAGVGLAIFFYARNAW